MRHAGVPRDAEALAVPFVEALEAVCRSLRALTKVTVVLGFLERWFSRARMIAFPDKPREPDLLHFAADEYALPYCGARLGARVTREIEAATCERCLQDGWSVVWQYRANTR